MNVSNAKRWIFGTLLLTIFTVGCSKIPLMNARTDQQVAAEVQVKLNADANLPTKGIAVTATNGIVTLTGAVTSETERLTAANDAAQIEGVKTVVNNLTVAAASAMPIEPIPVRRAAPARRVTTSPAPVNTAPHNVASEVPVAAAAPVVPPPPPPIPTITVPAGTEITIRTIDAINSETANVGDSFMATLDQAVYVGDTIAIPSGADVQGRVVDVKSAGRYAGQSTLVLKLTRLSFNGKTYQLDTNHWSKSGSSRGKNTAAKVGGGAALGAIIGGIAGGGKGAAIGATVGAGAGAGVQTVTKGQQIDLRSESSLTFNLQNPVTVTPSASNRNRGRVMSDNQ